MLRAATPLKNSKLHTGIWILGVILEGLLPPPLSPYLDVGPCLGLLLCEQGPDSGKWVDEEENLKEMGRNDCPEGNHKSEIQPTNPQNT